MKSARLLIVVCLVCLGLGCSAASVETSGVVHAVTPVLEYLKGTTPTLDLAVSYDTPAGASWEPQGGLVVRVEADGALDLRLDFKDRSIRISRTATRTEIALPQKGVVFRGEGEVAAGDRFDPREVVLAALNAVPELASGWFVTRLLSPPAVAEVLVGELPPDAFTADASGAALSILLPDGRGRVRIGPVPSGADAGDTKTELRIVTVDRGEMERTLRRGVVRTAVIEADKRMKRMPSVDCDQLTTVPNGRLEVTDGHRLLLLNGTPYETGLAHGRLLAREVRMVADSTLYTVGLGYSLESGKWFPAEMRDAWRRLEPFVPADQIDEIRGIAEGSGVGFEEVKLANFFPELFHCSGFAISGEATKGGKLYHGRVLDYMTGVGLQGCAAVIVTKNPGRLAWVNVGYAGFNGSVSGMNEKKIALGEMGGRGEGNWDGVPMGTLMRRALQDAASLGDAKRVFSESPRTCEYYYVLSDGNARSAVGVYALPDKIEFVEPGAAHELLPDPLRDCVLLSAGDRYKRLVDRTRKGYGAIDEQSAIALMDRGVAMSGSNLHNVLFVPEDLVFFVANAGTDSIAAAEPYLRYDLTAILRRMPDAADRP